MTRYLLYAAFALVQLLSAVSATAVSVAFPQVAADYGSSIALATWVFNASQLGVLAVTLVAGSMCDLVGKRRLAIIALLLFSAGSLLSAIAPNIYLLILARLLVGAANGALGLTFIAIAADLFPESRQKAIGLIASAYFVGMIVGPNMGGWVTESLGWRWVFWLSIPIGVIGIAACSAMTSRDRTCGTYPINVRGAAIFAASMAFLTVGLSVLGNVGEGMPGWAGGMFMAVGVVLLLGFIRFERRSERPLVDQQLLRRREFLASHLFNVAYGVVWSMSSLAPLYAVSIYGLSTLQSGLAVTPWTVALTASTTVASFFVARTGYRIPMIAGSLAVIAAFLLLGLELKGVSAAGFRIGGPGVMLAVMGLLGLGAGSALPAINNVCIDLAPDRIAAITGLRYTFRGIGGAFAIAIASALLSAFGLDRGFTIVMMGTAGVLAIALPAIWVMPRSPTDLGAPGRRQARPEPGCVE
ncbi:MAG: MFS transporter [Dehalococcoidia bacterium]|nr:MFS transporter [Dehalococcoidia bacterium]